LNEASVRAASEVCTAA